MFSFRDLAPIILVVTVSLLAFGACHLDRIARLDSSPHPASIPGRVTSFPGGAAFNVCRHVAQAGFDPCLWTAGDVVVDRTMAVGVDLRALPNEGTSPPSYTAILDPSGGLVVAVADMERYDTLPPFIPEELAGATEVLIDANLSATFLAELVANIPASARVHAMAVSPAKVGRLLPFADRVDVLFASRAEIEALPGKFHEACALFRAVVVTEGHLPVRHVSAGRTIVQVIELIDPRDVTGAGDAMAGGFIGARLSGADVRQALASGASAARRTILAEGPFPFEDAT